MKYFRSYVERGLYILLLLVFLAASFIIFLQYRTNTHLAKQAVSLQQQIDRNKQLTEQVKSLGEQNKQLSLQIKNDTDNIKMHIDCIATLFAQPDRANTIITDVTSCQLNQVSSSGGATGYTKSTVTAPTNSTASQSTTSQPVSSNSTTPPKRNVIQRLCSRIPVVKKLCS